MRALNHGEFELKGAKKELPILKSTHGRDRDKLQRATMMALSIGLPLNIQSQQCDTLLDCLLQ